MSHLVKQVSTVKITNLNILDKACKRLPGLTLDRNCKTARYYGGATRACDAVIRCEGSIYDVALTRNEKGEYEVEADLFDTALRIAVSNDTTVRYDAAQCGKLFENYRVEENIDEALANGYSIVADCYDPSTQQHILEFAYNG